MARTEETDDSGEFRPGGDDSCPLVSLVPEPPPSHWGKITSQARTMSPAYMRFLYGKKESRDGRNK
jgi:hypothetical protein